MRRRHGFTLIELLVVISIMILLITILMPAVLKARITVMVVMVRGQVSAMSSSCDAYYTYYKAYPGVIADPPDHSGSPGDISGAQNLRLSLLGAKISGSTITEQYQGPAKDAKSYDSGSRIYEAFYTPSDNELKSHGSLSSSFKASGGDYDDSIEIFVDHRLSPPLPLLYFRQRPTYGGNDPFEADDNEAYYTSTTLSGGSAPSDSALSAMAAETKGFYIVSAGPDRTYFTSDDITNMAD